MAVDWKNDSKQAEGRDGGCKKTAVMPSHPLHCFRVGMIEEVRVLSEGVLPVTLHKPTPSQVSHTGVATRCPPFPVSSPLGLGSGLCLASEPRPRYGV